MTQAPRPASQQLDLSPSYQIHLDNRYRQSIRREAQCTIEARIFQHLKQCEASTRVAGQAILWNFALPLSRKLSKLAALERATPGLFPPDITDIFATNGRVLQRRNDSEAEHAHDLAALNATVEAPLPGVKEELLPQAPQIVIHTPQSDETPRSFPHVRRPLNFRCCHQMFGCVPSWRSLKSWMWSWL